MRFTRRSNGVVDTRRALRTTKGGRRVADIEHFVSDGLLIFPQTDTNISRCKLYNVF